MIVELQSPYDYIEGLLSNTLTEVYAKHQAAGNRPGKVKLLTAQTFVAVVFETARELTPEEIAQEVVPEKKFFISTDVDEINTFIEESKAEGYNDISSPFVTITDVDLVYFVVAGKRKVYDINEDDVDEDGLEETEE